MATYDYSGDGKGVSAVGANRRGVMKFLFDIAALNVIRVANGLAAFAVGDVITFATLPLGSIVAATGLLTLRPSTSATSTLTMGSTGGSTLSVSGALNGKLNTVQPGTVTNGLVHPSDTLVQLTVTITAETTMTLAGAYAVYVELSDLT